MSRPKQNYKFDFDDEGEMIEAHAVIYKEAMSQEVPINNILGAERTLRGRHMLANMRLRYNSQMQKFFGSDWEPPPPFKLKDRSKPDGKKGDYHERIR